MEMETGNTCVTPRHSSIQAGSELSSEWMEKLMSGVKDQISRITEHSFADMRVDEILDEALAGSGKMIRPQLLMLSASYGPDMDKELDRLKLLAALVELTHLASLIHDDIVDEAEYRRGKASIQSRFGKDAAVYAGDFLMSRIYYYQAKEGLNEGGAILSKTDRKSVV